jgi:hypothetical protein
MIHLTNIVASGITCAGAVRNGTPSMLVMVPRALDARDSDHQSSGDRAIMTRKSDGIRPVRRSYSSSLELFLALAALAVGLVLFVLI